MRTFSIVVVILLLLSCNKSGNNPIPVQPLPPVDSSQPASHINFGKLIFLSDTFRIYDANTGKLQIYSGPYGILAGAFINNTTVDSNLVYQAGEDALIALNSTTGNVQYTKYFALGHSVVSNCFPIIEGNYLYQCFYNYLSSDLYCLNKRTGDTVWLAHTNFGADADEFFPTTDQTSQNIIVAGINGPACFSKANGKLVWSNYSTGEYAKFRTPTVCTEDKVLFFNQQNTILYAFDAKNGNFLWKLPLSSYGYIRSAKPFLYNNKVYITILPVSTDLQHGSLVVSIDLNTGQVIDKFSYPIATGAVVYYDQYFYLSEDPTLTSSPIRLSKHLLSNGSTLWTTTLKNKYGYGLVNTPGYLYYTEQYTSDESSTKLMDIIDQASGNLEKQYPVFTDISFTPAVVDSLGHVYYQPR
jgi:outer membrane protein assembly factor BamB